MSRPPAVARGLLLLVAGALARLNSPAPTRESVDEILWDSLVQSSVLVDSADLQINLFQVHVNPVMDSGSGAGWHRLSESGAELAPRLLVDANMAAVIQANLSTSARQLPAPSLSQAAAAPGGSNASRRRASSESSVRVEEGARELLSDGDEAAALQTRLSVVDRSSPMVNQTLRAAQGGLWHAKRSLANDSVELLAPGDTTSKQPTSEQPWESATGVRADNPADLKTLLVVLTVTGTLVAAAVVFLSAMRRACPQVFANNTRMKAEGGLELFPPGVTSKRFFGWIIDTYKMTLAEIRQCAGMDCAMVLEFAELATRLLLWLAVPLVSILLPLHAIWGHGGLQKLGLLGINNVENGSWLFWIHAFAVWYVVIVVEHFIFRAMRTLQLIRFKWLLDLEPPRSTTVLVEGVPESHCSDFALKAYFEMLFPDAVESAFIVKHTRVLKSLGERLKDTKLALEKAKFRRTKLTLEGDRDGAAALDTKLNELQAEVNELEVEVKAEQERILRDGELPMVPQENEYGEKVMVLSEEARAVNTSSGFVTFTSERTALLALNIRCSADVENFVMSIPPQPSDIIYDDLRVPLLRQKLWGVMGYSLIIGVFWSYFPFILIISSATNLETLRHSAPVIDRLVKAWPAAQVLLEGFLSTLALTIFMSFLPSIFMWIFKLCFSLKSLAWAQLKLQVWYFWFMVVFIVLITTLGGSLINTIHTMFERPTSTFDLLADSLPTATHFYLNFQLMQVASHCTNLCRFPQLFKYWGLRAVLHEDRAVELCEPEDQDYHGIGGRSARISVNLAISIIFCILNPLILLVGLFNFAACRLVFGYLIVFAEIPKHDLGGVFYVQSLWHLQAALFMFNCLMIGVVHRRAESAGPVVIASLALVYLLYCVHRFNAFSWEQLPFEEWCSPEAVAGAEEEMERYRAKGENRARYVQPELYEDTWIVKGNVLDDTIGHRPGSNEFEGGSRKTLHWNKVRASMVAKQLYEDFDRRRSM